MRQSTVQALALLASLSVPSVALAEDVRVFILAGQSNAVGYGEGADLPAALANQTDVLYDFFNPASRINPDYANTASLDWEPLTPKGIGQWYGPEITFADQIKAALPDRRTAVVKVMPGNNTIKLASTTVFSVNGATYRLINVASTGATYPDVFTVIVSAAEPSNVLCTLPRPAAVTVIVSTFAAITHHPSSSDA